MKIRYGSVLSFIMLMLAAYGLYQVKWQVHHLKRQNMMIEARILEEKEALSILDAEWAYLNRPDRLRDLAAKYLDLSPETGQQMVELTKFSQSPDRVMMAAADNATAAGSQTGIQPVAAKQATEQAVTTEQMLYTHFTAARSDTPQ
jgi:hypothetical protein